MVSKYIQLATFKVFALISQWENDEAMIIKEKGWKDKQRSPQNTTKEDDEPVQKKEMCLNNVSTFQMDSLEY